MLAHSKRGRLRLYLVLYKEADKNNTIIVIGGAGCAYF